MEIQPLTVLKDRYRVQEKLAMGGMGAVYLAHDNALDTLVAIKANTNPGEHSSRQFLREAKLLASLRHQNLPRVTDHFILEDAQYLVMDYIPGDDLSELLESKGPQPLEKVLDWGMQLSQALTYLHSQNPPIIHRDIKPSNIKITPQGHLILVDFGIAKVSDSGSTATGARGLTPGFAPPEQYGSGKTSPATDQYALAATLYTLLTGQEPAEAVERMLGNITLQPPRDIDASIPAHVDAAIQHALAIQPENRFSNVAEFISALGNPEYIYDAATLPADRSVEEAVATLKPKARSRLPVFMGLLIIVGIAAAAAYFQFGIGNGQVAVDQSVLETETASAKGTQAALAALPSDTPSPSLTPTRIPASQTPAATFTPSPAPTPKGGGALIAFVSNRGDGRTFQVFSIRLDGSGLAQLTFTEGNKSDPTWSPDGTKLLYVGRGGRDNFGNELGGDIWAMNADGSEHVNLTQSVGDDYDPAWSTDGELIVFTSTRVEATPGLPQLFIMNADGSEPNWITRGYGAEYSPTWSPDGQWIAFAVSIRSAPARLFLRTSEGVDPRAFDVGARLGQIDDPAFSPDGRTIIYTCVSPVKNEICLVVFESKGADIFMLTNSLGNKQPAWSPDGHWILFTSTRDQNSEIYIMDSLGRNQVNITNNDAIDRDPTWQPQPSP